jgi:hypothetical protein
MAFWACVRMNQDCFQLDELEKLSVSGHIQFNTAANCRYSSKVRDR